MKEWKEYKQSYKSTAGMFRDFLKSIIWADLSSTLEEALELTRDGLEMAADWDSTMRLQQDADCLKRFMEMPSVILDDMEISIKKEAAEAESEIEDFKQEEI